MANTGWYNDESDPTLARWHDGVGWTEHVVLKADWEGVGEPPPPLDDLEPGGTGRLRMLIGSAAVVAVLVVGGAALARDGSDDEPGRAPTTGRSGSAGSFDELGDDGDAVVDPTVVGSEAGSPASGDDPAGANGSTAGSGTSRTTSGSGASGTAGSGSVRRTETSTQTRSNTTPISSAASEDKTSVGNTNDETIKDTFTPPPDTTPTSAPESTTSTTT